MTATLPHGPSTTVRGPTLGRRLSSVYAFTILDDVTGQPIPDDYVGQTVRPVPVREAEHRGQGRNPDCEQPWSDRIVGSARIVEQGWWTPAELDAREQYWIAVLQPRRNYDHNLHNPARLPIPAQRQARAERDRQAAVVSRWTHPERFTGPVLRPSLPVGPSLWSRFWATAAGRTLAGWLRKAAVVAGVWAALTGVLWLAVWQLADVADPEAGPLCSIAAGLAVAKWWPRKRKHKGRSRQHRTRRRSR